MGFYFHLSIFSNVFPMFMYDFARQIKKKIKALFPSNNNFEMTYLWRHVSKREIPGPTHEGNCTMRSLRSEEIPNTTWARKGWGSKTCSSSPVHTGLTGERGKSYPSRGVKYTSRKGKVGCREWRFVNSTTRICLYSLILERSTS